MKLTTRTVPMQAPPRKEEIPETYPKGRVCSRDLCDTILSIYHAGPECYACGIKDIESFDPEVLLAELMEEAF